MALLKPAFNYLDEPGETRRFQRVPVMLSGRYMLESHREFPCHTLEMSPGDMALSGPVKARLGEKVIVYLDQIGRLAGVTIRTTEQGFVLMLDLSPKKRDRLADQLTWYANRDAIGLSDDRRHDRIVPITPYLDASPRRPGSDRENTRRVLVRRRSRDRGASRSG